jgi:CBS domain-containing protein
MFAVYGISGPIFTGTLEKLNQVSALARARPVRAIAANGDELGVSPASNHHREEAVRAYRSMLPRDLERGPLYHADQIMQREVITVSAGDEAARAWRNLRSHHIHQAPVLDDDARLVGIVSERDLLMVLDIEADRIVDSLGRYVRDVMTTPVVAAAPVTDIRRIAKVMLDRQVDGVPIVNEDGLLVGFVSRSEILRAVVVDPPLSLWR